MIIEHVKIEIELASGKKYGNSVNFKSGNDSDVSLIFGSNELGKTTLFKCIVYALGGEEIYGKNNILPYIISEIEGEKAITSKIYLQLNNGVNRVVIERDALNANEPIIVYYDCLVSNTKEAASIKYFKVKKDRNIEGNELYQDFLFNYFSIPHVVDEEMGVQIYFQNIMPMFIIPQNAWNDIQANNPFYGVHNVRQRAFEIVLGFNNNVNNFSYSVKLKSLQAKINVKEKQLEKLKEVMQLFLTSSDQDNEKMVMSNNEQMKEYSEKINEMEKTQEISAISIQPYKEKFKNLKNIERRYQEQIDLLKREIEEYEYYLNNIDSEIVKLDKLKTAKRLISVLPVKECPHCLNTINIDEEKEIKENHCNLCGSELNNIKEANNNDMYQYLKDEKRDFDKIKESKSHQLNNIKNKLYIIRLDIKELQEYMNNVDLKLKPDFLREYSYYYNEIGRIKNVLSTLEKEKISISSKSTLEGDIEKLKKQLKELNNDSNFKEIDEYQKKFRFFENTFKSILKDLDFLKDGFDGAKTKEVANEKIFSDIYIDEESYYPKMKGKNLYNITSSSGLIRIIIAYYLAILKTSIEFKEGVNHPKIFMMDEPRQQNLDSTTFNKIVEYLITLTKDTGIQVIYTSGDKGSIADENIALDLNSEGMLIKELKL